MGAVHGEVVMRRRRFFDLVAASTVATGPAAGQSVPRKVGVLVVAALGWDNFWQLLREAMRELGYVEGQTVDYEFRSDEGDTSRLPALAAELVHLKVDVIVTWYTPAALAAQHATTEIPIVMALAGNPVETGLVRSLDRPGGNITGMAGAAGELASKVVELVRELLPSAHRIAALANEPDPFARPFVDYVRAGASANGLAVDVKMIRGKEGVEEAFQQMAADRSDAVVVQPSAPRRLAAELALRYRIAAVSVIHGFTEEGGVMSYAPAESFLYRRAAMIIDKVLKGVPPARIPVEQPTRFELLLNLRTARALGLSVPPVLLARADSVID
jgi:putative ABC transport system substrate-binding protein